MEISAPHFSTTIQQTSGTLRHTASTGCCSSGPNPSCWPREDATNLSVTAVRLDLGFSCTLSILLGERPARAFAYGERDREAPSSLRRLWPKMAFALATVNLIYMQ